MVVGRRYLDHVGRNQVESLQAAQDTDHFTTGNTGDLGRTRTRRVGRIEHVDID